MADAPDWQATAAHDALEEYMGAPERKMLTPNGGLPTGNWPENQLVEYVRADLLAERDKVIEGLVGALNDTLLMPKGSIPASADPYFDGTTGRFTVARALAAARKETA